MKRIVARFIGRNSCGFVNGRVYQLKSSVEIENKVFMPKAYLWIEDCFGFGKCPYDSLEKILENWEVIGVTK